MPEVPPATPERNFKTAYCARFECPPEAFERSLLWRCLPWLSRPLAVVFRVVLPAYYDMEMEALSGVGQARNLAEVYQEANGVSTIPGARDGLLRGVLRQRMSGRRLMRVAATVWPEAAGHPNRDTVISAAATVKYVAPEPKRAGIARPNSPGPALAPPAPVPAPPSNRPRPLGIRKSPYGKTGTRRAPQE